MLDLASYLKERTLVSEIYRFVTMGINITITILDIIHVLFLFTFI
jgi:hypothetical protein